MCYNPRVGKSPPPIDRRHWPVRFSHFCPFFIPTVFTLDPVSLRSYLLDPIKPLLILRDSTRLCAVFVKQRKNIYGVPLWQSNGKLIEEEEKNRRGGRKEQVTVTEEGEKEGKRRRKKWFLSSRRIVCSVFLVDGIARIGSWFVMGVGNSLSDVVTTSSPAER